MNQEQLKVGRFLFMQDFPEEILKTVLSVFEGQEWLLPPWCHEAIVTYHSGLTECAMDSEVQYDYRRLRIRIAPSFLNETPDSQRSMTRHELLHASTNVPFIYAECVIRDILKGDENETFRKRVLKDMRERHESAVSDLEYCLSQMPRVESRSKAVKQ